MTEKVVFIDHSSIGGSVVKILARNILLLTNDAIDVIVIKLEDIDKYVFTKEKMVLVDPVISLNHPLLRRIPKRIKQMNFTIGSYVSLNAEAVLEQIETNTQTKRRQ